MCIYCINVPVLFELVGTKRKTKTKPNTKGENQESCNPGVRCGAAFTYTRVFVRHVKCVDIH